MNRSKISALALSGVALLTASAVLSACNTSGVDFLKSMTLTIVQQNGSDFFKLTSAFDLGNVSLAEMTVGIVDPHTRIQEGEVDFSQLPNGQSQIALLANTNLLPNADLTLGQTMPNGKPLPAVLGSNGAVLGIKILDHSVLYMGGNIKDTAYVGIALGIKGFDSVMGSLSTSVNVFFMGNFGPNVLGVGGIYGSTTADESGIALFGKYTATTTTTTTAARFAKKTSTPQLANDYAIEKLNNANANKLMKYFYGKKRKVTVY